MSAISPNATYWKRKLAAYLHDPPSKCLDIANHQDQSEKAMLAAGLGTPEERKAWSHQSDHTAAAADRFPFPDSKKSGLRCAFDGVRNCFRHPLSGDPLPFDDPFLSLAEGIEGEQTTQPVIHDFGDLTENEQWRARFFAHWRLWPGASAQKDWRLGFLPADTRIPDHAIWPHMQMVSALEGSRGETGDSRSALLKFQLGPVQEFIQAARSTLDLWSGSYLLSWLMARGLARLALECGPDAVVFPNLRDQPLFDLALKDLWNRVKIGEKTVWEETLGRDFPNGRWVTPNLPNVFLALVPETAAECLARNVEEAIRAEWKTIADSVWEACQAKGLWELDTGLPTGEALRQRWSEQVEHFLHLAWSITPIPDSLEDIEAAQTAVPAESVRRNYASVKRAAEAIHALGHGDDRYFDEGGRLKNHGIAWSLAVSLAGWQLDAVRQTRSFPAKRLPPNDEPRQGRHFTKDSLTGREEAVAGGAAWMTAQGELGSRFKHDDFLSAPSLVKRLWDITFLRERHGLKRPRMSNTRDLAAGHPDRDSADEDPVGDGEHYFAVLALDGDDMGKWVAGEKTPRFRTQLADYDGGGALGYFQRPAHADQFSEFLETPRPLSPGYHLQFSESLSNFALRCARPIVEAYKGRLIYAGGDDVLALLPADAALPCARELRHAFCGSELSSDPDHGIQQKAPGFLTSRDDREITGKIDPAAENPLPFVVPGPRASASVGIAIAHFKSPLQDAVKAAQAAEKRAKRNPGKDSVAVTVLKRSGETVEWSAGWTTGGVDAALSLLEAIRGGLVSSKFPYRLAELISPYRNRPAPLGRLAESVPGFDLSAVLQHELDTVLGRQQGPSWKNGGIDFASQFGTALARWTEALHETASDDEVISQVMALCAFCGFAKRQES